MNPLNNPILKGMHAIFNNITRNAVFYSSDMIPIDHKNRIFPSDLKTSLGIPENINNWFDYTISLGTNYSRLKMLTIISACSDVEFLLKKFIEEYYDTNANMNKNFYQLLDDVNKEIFIPKGINLNNESFFEKIKIAFQVRHISIHNMGFVDETFNQKTNLNLPLDTEFEIDNVFINDTFDAIEQLIQFLDNL
ncbi:hypothetical protein [Chryseobacterium sp. W4I1]|uniref:hypothetical protein n=1 Tax=Chryseobacterium sp. W4I1 TaxID=3042293 RepID=UPI002780CADD|nr:hypothetical protein [Chryseobacterium sp. W4I1]MDQ0783070.1 hypothetical protein [Chryseobacterium sp. W4I1]